MSKYCELKSKAYKCRENAARAESEWAKKFWIETSLKIENQLNEMTLGEAEQCQ